MIKQRFRQKVGAVVLKLIPTHEEPVVSPLNPHGLHVGPNVGSLGKFIYVMSMVFLRKFGLNEAKRVYCGIPGGEPLNKYTYCKENVEYISIILTIYHN